MGALGLTRVVAAAHRGRLSLGKQSFKAAGAFPKRSANFGNEEAGAAALTPYATAYRYPGGSYEPMPKAAVFEEALQHARAIYVFVLNRLPTEAQP